MKKSLIKVTAALGIILGGLIPFSHLPGVDNEVIAYSNSSGSSETSDIRKL